MNKQELLTLWLFMLILEFMGLAVLTIILWQGYSGIWLWVVGILAGIKMLVQITALNKIGETR